jgi:acetyl-CoA C-acetyltransferase
VNREVCIVAARRTPQGSFLGALANCSAVELAVGAGKAAIEGIDNELIDWVILGNVVAAGQGMNVARQVGLRLGLPQTVPAFAVNMMCASGMYAVALAAQAIQAGQAHTVLCGGSESMSNAPYLLERARSGGYRLEDGQVVDAVLRDGLIDPLAGEHMGLTAERLAKEYDISRQEQDTFALRSQRRYFQALERGLLKAEVAAMQDLDRDEHPRADTSLERLATLKPIFDPAGTITAGNASGINDGAAMLLVCDMETARQAGWEALAIIKGWSVVGCDPARMGLGPVHAVRALCAQHGCAIDDFDTVEINEAFAAQVLACLRALDLGEADHVNPDGGAIAVGHPIGASGARLVAHLAHRIAGGHTHRGLATLCVGGGMGMAIALERA